MREHASLGARRERDVTEPSHTFQYSVLEERTVLWNCWRRKRKRALSSCDPERRKVTPRAIASNKSVVACTIPPETLCVGGTRGDDECEGKHIQRGFAWESRRESRVEARARKSGRGQRRGPRRTGAKQRDCDGKQQPHLTSRAHGARKNGLNKEAEKHGNVKMTRTQHMVGRKHGAKRQINSKWKQSGQ